MQGYIKTYRQLLGSTVFTNADLLKVWIWCLLKASHKEHTQMVGYQEQLLLPGQFIFGRKKAALELGYSEPKTYRLILRLKQLQNVTIQSNNKYSVVTIVNWELYQGNGIPSEQQNEQQMNNKRTTNEQQTNTNKNVKNVKNEKNKDYSSQIKDLRSRYSVTQLQTIDEYMDILRWTRTKGNIADSVIVGIYKKWEEHPVPKVIYGLKTYINNPKHHDKRENYCYGIIRNVKMEEIEAEQGQQRPLGIPEYDNSNLGKRNDYS